jgi:succinate dehydrogenase / fumarate reductase flavoprotein subunit
MELVQFHPTGMVWPEDIAGTLVTEAVRGEGGHLLNADGERYMARYDAERMELSARDLVALASYNEILQGRGGPHGGVFLDISHRTKDYILEKLPRMYRQFIEYQLLDISREPMEVAPTAHYSMGGVVVDPETHAGDVEGLYAAGEVTAGLHGANRLGGNSLTETVVFGKRVGEAAAAASKSMDAQPRSRAALQEALDELNGLVREGTEIVRPVQRALRDTMWECGGVVRSEAKIDDGLERVAEIKEALPSIDVRPTAEGYGDLAHLLDLRASLAVAEATLLGARERQETRGAHNRSDYPELDRGLTATIRVRREDERLELERVPVPAVPPHLGSWADDGADIDSAGRLLE